MKRGTYLSQEEKKRFIEVAREILAEKCGDNWQKRFKEYKEKKVRYFPMPVLANIVLFDIRKDIKKNKLANMVMKKIHDHEVEEVVKLLRTFLSFDEIQEKWFSIKDSVQDEQKREDFEIYLISA